MLKEITVGNFRSYQNHATLSLTAETLRSSKVKTIKTEEGALLPAVGIFGSNASGKSNIIKALAYIQWAVKNVDVLNQPTTRHEYLRPFRLSKNSRKQPSFFEVVLVDEKHDTEYRYGFEVDREQITKEWLNVTSRENKQRRNRSVFERLNQKFTVSRHFTKELNPRIGQVNPHGLAIATFAQLNFDLALTVVSLLSEPNLVIYDGAANDVNIERALSRCRNDDDFKAKVTTLIHQADLGIQDISMEEVEIPKEALKQIPLALRRLIKESGEDLTTRLMVYASHKMQDSKESVHFNLRHDESLGTQRFIILASLVIEALEHGSLLVVDELGASLHPFLTRAVLEQFQNPKVNTRNAQLIFGSHETFLLTKHTQMRRDQIWFAQKEKEGSCSTLNSLASSKIRNDYEVAKNLLEKNLGYIPDTSFPEF